jgi:hypothetical protein
MIPYRMTIAQYQDMVAEGNEADRTKRSSATIKSGLRPFRRPVLQSGHKLNGLAYRHWLVDQEENA